MPTKITLVGDEERLNGLIARLNQEKEYEVGLCSLGPEAFKCIKEQEPEVVVIDWSEPSSTSYNLVSVMMTDTTLGTLPVVLCAIPGFEAEQLRSQYSALHLFVVRAPFTPDDVAAKIEEARGSQQQPG